MDFFFFLVTTHDITNRLGGICFSKYGLTGDHATMASHDKFSNGRESRVLSREEKKMRVGAGWVTVNKACCFHWLSLYLFFPHWALLPLSVREPPSGPRLYLAEVAVYSS